MVLITTAVYLYKKHHDGVKKNEEIKELAHDGNFTLPEKVPSIPSSAEAGTHWRMGVDPAAKGAVHHDSDLQFISESRGSTDSCKSAESVDGLWDEVAEMVDCPTPRQSDFDASGGGVGETGEFEEGGGDAFGESGGGCRGVGQR